MAYKKYIKRGSKTYGPYVYNSRKEGGKVITEYLGKYESKNSAIFLILLVSLILISLFSYLLIENPDSFQTVKNIAFNSISSITGLVTEEGTPAGEAISEETSSDESANEETISEQINLEENIAEEAPQTFPEWGGRGMAESARSYSPRDER